MEFPLASVLPSIAEAIFEKASSRVLGTAIKILAAKQKYNALHTVAVKVRELRIIYYAHTPNFSKKEGNTLSISVGENDSVCINGLLYTLNDFCKRMPTETIKLNSLSFDCEVQRIISEGINKVPASIFKPERLNLNTSVGNEEQEAVNNLIESYNPTSVLIDSVTSVDVIAKPQVTIIHINTIDISVLEEFTDCCQICLIIRKTIVPVELLCKMLEVAPSENRRLVGFGSTLTENDMNYIIDKYPTEKSLDGKYDLINFGNPNNDACKWEATPMSCNIVMWFNLNYARRAYPYEDIPLE